MPQPVFTLNDGIFIIAKQVEPIHQKPVQPSIRIGVAGGVNQLVQSTQCICKIRQYGIACVQIRLGSVQRRQPRDIFQLGLGNFLAVVFIERPLAAFGAVAFHQDI